MDTTQVLLVLVGFIGGLAAGLYYGAWLYRRGFADAKELVLEINKIHTSRKSAGSASAPTTPDALTI